VASCLLFAQTPVAYYPFSGNANDAAGSSHGTVNGAILTTDRFGNANSAYNFDGIDDFIEANADNFPAGNRTISLWFNADPGSIAAKPGVFGYGGDGSCGSSFFMGINNTPSASGAFQIQGHCNSNLVTSAYGAAPENAWYNWTVTINGTTAKIYINGTLMTTGTWSNATVVAGRKVSVGSIVSPSGGSNYADGNISRFKGKIDDIKVFGIALTDAQVANEYTSSSLVAYYPFTGNANDAVGTNHGTVNGALLTTDRFGNTDNAYLFDGLDDFIGTANNATTVTDNWTMTAWIKPASLAQAGNIVMNGFDNGSSGNGYSILIGNGSSGPGNKLTALFCGVSFFDPNLTLTETDVWYQVAMVRSNGLTTMYLNGVAGSNTTGVSPATPAGSLRIGGQNGVRFFNGAIDEVKVYNAALTSTQLTEAYLADITKPGSGSAITFNGTTQQADLGTWFNFQNFTLEMWVKPGATQVDFADIIDNNHTGSRSWVVQQNGALTNTYYFGVNASPSGTTNDFTLIPNKWQHLAFVKDATSVSVYVNGILAGSNSIGGSVVYDGSEFLRLANWGGGGRNWNGSMDEVRIWNTALTQTEVRDWMTKKITSSHPSFANLAAYYRFDEGNGTRASGINGRNATLVNTPAWILSGAALGNASANTYPAAATQLSHPEGESLTTTPVSGAPAGIHVYRVDEQPNSTSGVTGVGSNNRYFGVFVVGGTNPTYDVVYNYSGNPFAGTVNESSLRLFKRADNSVTMWTDAGATQDMNANTLTATGQNTEYILGSIASPLPVTLVNFTAVKCGNKVCLQWKTATEENVSHFEIERSPDARSFEKIITVTAQNRDNANYSTIDANLLNGVLYYRLKMIDTDGSFTYSRIAKLDFSKKFTVFISPNPVKGVVHIQGSENFGQIEILDVMGKRVKTLKPTADNNYNLQFLSKGLYWIRLLGNGNEQSLKFVKE